MIFDFSKFIVNNLKSGYSNGTWNKEQVSIFSVNYVMKGQISQEQFEELQLFLNPPDPEPEQSPHIAQQ